MQPVEEVGAEASGLDLGERIAVGGADDAHVDPLQFAAADPPEAAGLQEAQELGLQAEVHLGDLVEEQRAAVGEFGRAGAVLRRAGEGAAHMAEDLALHQVFRDGAAIDRDERAVRPGRQWAWIASAQSSLPVPLSPVMNTGARDGAMRRICS